MKLAKFIGILVYKNTVKKRDKVKKNRDSSKFWTKNQDCPSKNGTVGEYGIGTSIVLTIDIVVACTQYFL